MVAALGYVEFIASEEKRFFGNVLFVYYYNIHVILVRVVQLKTWSFR